jgi:hypothetical protein
VLADIDMVPSWSPLHKHAEVLDRYSDGRPHHVKATLKIMGITDKEVLEYHWGDRWMVWDAAETFQPFRCWYPMKSTLLAPKQLSSWRSTRPSRRTRRFWRGRV